MGDAFIQANTNGRLHDACEPSLPPLNRGFLYGDAIYEVWRTYENVLFAWDEHWRRLENSARALHIGIPMERDRMFEEIHRTARSYRQATGHAGELYVRLQITRGAGAIGLDPALADRPDYVILVQPNKDIPAEIKPRGYRLSYYSSTGYRPYDSTDTRSFAERGGEDFDEDDRGAGFDAS